ncbi:MAG: CocE/NonD family hydrolase [Pseudomonadota bacterium]
MNKQTYSRRTLLKSALALATLTTVSACRKHLSEHDQHLAESLKEKLAIRNIEHLWIPMPDGRRLAARIWLPTNAEDEPVPAILEYLPYRKRDMARLRPETAHVYAAVRGYAGVRVDIQGTGESDGILGDEYLLQEQLDGVEIIKWLAKQPWCSGSVGMRGISWGGFNSLQIAAHNPPELKAIITHCSTDDRYTDDAHYIGGSLGRVNFEWGQGFMNVLTLPPDPELFGPTWREEWFKRLDNVGPVTHNWMRHQRRDSYWQHGSVNEDYSKIKCAVYAVGGFVDAYTNSIPRMLEGLSVPRKGLIGPYGHNFPDEVQIGPAIGFYHEEVRWWDHWLKGIDTGLMEEPMLQVYMQETTPGQVFPEDVPGRWVAERTWPSTRIKERTYHLNSGGLASEPGEQKAITLAPDQTTGLENPAWLPFAMETELPRDQTKDDNKSLKFDSEALDKNLEICGHPVAKLKFSVDKPVARVAVRLNEVRPDGTSWYVTGGYLNLTHRDGHAEPQPLVPGEVYEVDVPLYIIAHRFKAGHKIRIALSESYWPMIWPSPEAVQFTLYTGTSRVTLPIRPVGSTDLENLSFTDPALADMSGVTFTTPGTHKQEVSDPSEDGIFESRTLSESGGLLINEIGTEMSRAYDWVSSIDKSDPTSAMWGGYHAMTLNRDDWDIKTLSNYKLKSDKNNFYVFTEVVVSEKGEVIFKREWQETIARDLG